MIPLARHKSATFRPASPSLIARICSSVNLLRSSVLLWNGGPHLTRGGSEGARQNHFVLKRHLRWAGFRLDARDRSRAVHDVVSSRRYRAKATPASPSRSSVSESPIA